MATIGKDKNGRKRILFQCPETKKRKTIRIGKASVKNAEAVKTKVEALLACKASGCPWDAPLATWVGAIDDELADKLAKLDLIPPRDVKAIKPLGDFLRSHIDSRSDVKSSTKRVWGLVESDLLDFFGADRRIDAITPGDADDFKQYLVQRDLASTTIHKRLQFARGFFRAMVRRRYISENPFADVSAPAVGIADRQRFVTDEEISLVIDQCPDHHWRCLVALARYAGLRVPSEALSIKWEDVNWERSRMVVSSPKTEHHPGMESRTVPMFPELRPFLEASWECAPDGAVYVVDKRFRTALADESWANVNLRTSFEKIVRRAGISPWPRLWHNLRASCETELLERFPLQAVTSWLGNSPSVAMRHYLMTTEEHFQRAITPEPSAAQNAAQLGAEIPRKEPQRISAEEENQLDLPVFAAQCESMQGKEVEDRGLENVPLSSGNTQIPDSRGTESGTLLTDSDGIDEDLQTVIDAWPLLNAAARESILRVVKANA